MCLNRFVLFICIVVNGCAIGNVKGATSSAIPELLYDCYRSNTSDTTTDFKAPLSIPLLIELIRKIEIDDVNAFNMRILATSMLHGVKFDGVRQSTSAIDDSLAIPFRASGEEFYKYRLVVDYLTSGESSLFPSDSLTTPELCFLHEIISNTVDPRERGDESSTCAHQPSMPLDSDMADQSDRVSACPIKKGVVKSKWGSVSPGQIVSAVASVLQASKVTYARVQEAIDSEEKNRTDSPPAITPNANNVNSVWVSTLAGNLAGVILNQATTKPEIGSDGFWNDTLLPRVYYLNSNKWDLTEAEILGGIDALAIASYVKNSLQGISKMRLSQLIDMYYSDRGVGSDNQYKATNRSATLARLLEEINLEEQVAGTAELLKKIGTYDFTYDQNEIKQLSSIVSERFKIVATNITKIHDNVEFINGKQMKSPVEIVAILDGSYDPYTAHQMLYALSEAAQVSHYGSKLGVINGQTGEWMVNVTGELFEVFAELEAARTRWPTPSLSLGSSLETVSLYYQNKTRTDCSNIAAKPLGKAILIVSPDSRLTDNDLVVSQRALSSIQKSYPEVRVIYVASQENNSSISELTKNFRDDDRVLTPPKDVLSFVEQVSNILSGIPGNIINFYCDQRQVRFEDYITPGVETFYQIRNEYLERTAIITNFSNSNYGDLSVCATTAYTKNEVCKDVTVNGEISFDSGELCASESACNLQFRISSNATNNLCVENDCRYPDQVRLNILSYKSSGFIPVFYFWYLIITLATAIYL